MHFIEYFLGSLDGLQERVGYERCWDENVWPKNFHLNSVHNRLLLVCPHLFYWRNLLL